MEIPFSSPDVFRGEEEKLAELKKSKEIIDMLTVILMEPQPDYDTDVVGLWYAFAHPKACEIVKRFNVKPKDDSSKP